MNRLFLLAAASAALAVGTSAGAAVLIDENFDALSDGATSVPGATIAVSGSATGSVTNTQAVSASNSFKLVDAADATAYHPYIRWDVTGQQNTIVQVSFDYRFNIATNGSPQFYVELMDGNTYRRARVQFNYTNLTAVTSGSGGTAFGTNALSEDTWHHVVMQVPTFDMTGATMTVKVDSTEYTNLSVWDNSDSSTAKINRVIFTDDGTNPDTIYLDNVKVETVPEPTAMGSLLLGGMALLGSRARR